jgi:hypothetical protein
MFVITFGGPLDGLGTGNIVEMMTFNQTLSEADMQTAQTTQLGMV